VDTVYLIFIAISLQQWLHEHASVLCYTYMYCCYVIQLLEVDEFG
jgi:hypothetical protein